MTVASAIAHNRKASERMAHMVFDEDVELILKGMTEASESALAKSHVGRPLSEAATPEGALELDRIWRSVDAAMGPGKSALQVLLARYARLQDATDGMTKLLRRGLRARTDVTRKLILDEMDRELKAFPSLRSDIAKSVEQSAGPVAKQLQGEMSDKVIQKASTLSSTEVKKECQAALDEMEQAFKNHRRALVNHIDSRPGTAALEARAKAMVTKLKKTSEVGKRAVIASRIKRVMAFPDGQKMAIDFSKKLKKKLRRTMPLLDDMEDSAVFFIDALGVAASAKPQGARLLRRFVEQGAGSLKPRELERISGYIGQMRGLLPEEVATRMKFLDSIFHKNAFEVLSDFPLALRSQMGVEMVEGPLWVIGHAGAPRQFGDGCMLLTGPNGQSAIIGLGEFKAGFDEDLLQQLFFRSDGRAVNSTVTFIGPDGKEQLRTLTREFAFEDGKKVAVTKPPTYVYGRPAGETEETAEMFKKMVDEQMKSGREVWKVPLPFSAKDNERFTQEAMKEAVNAMKKANKNWGI